MNLLLTERASFYLKCLVIGFKTITTKLILILLLLNLISNARAQVNDANSSSTKTKLSAAENDNSGNDEAFIIKIVNEDNKPIVGAVVSSLKNPRLKATTDESGSATLRVKPSGLISVSIDDFEKVFNYSPKNTVIKITSSDKKINVGFTNYKSKNELSSSVDLVYADKLEKSSLLNPMEGLYGRIKGLMVLQNGGNPWNKNPSIFLRGIGTSGNSRILTIIDGFERDLSAIVVSEIESISVLKDGTDLSKFGLRGANGVLQITTKRGKRNTFKIDTSFDYGINFPFRKPQFLDSYGYAKAVNQASILDGGNALYSDENLEKFRTGSDPINFPNTNWWKESLRDYGFTNNFNTTFHGGGDRTNYLVGLNYQNERGLIGNFHEDDRYDSGIKYDRLNFRANLDVDITSSTKFMVDGSGYIGGQNETAGGTGSVFNGIYSIPSAIFPVKTRDGVWSGSTFYPNNPVALAAARGVNKVTYRTLYTNGRLIQDASSILKGLSFELAVAYDSYASFIDNNVRTFSYKLNATSNLLGAETDLVPFLSFGDQSRHATGLGKIKYNTTFGESKLDISALYQEDKRVNDGQYNTFLRQNFMSTASYSFKSKYIIDGVLSYSGTNLLPKAGRFGLFPAVSGVWNIGQEDFLINSKIVNSLKLRGSWGISGSDLIPANNLDRQFFNPGGSYLFTNNLTSQTGQREGRLAGTGLTYESSEKLNFGLTGDFFNALNLSVDVFKETRSDIIISTAGAVPTLLGITAPFENSGIVENRGIEGSFAWTKNNSKGSYFVSGNITYARNKIINMNEELNPFPYLDRTGNSIGQQFGLQSIGFFNSDDDIKNSPLQVFSPLRPGDVKYKDQNNDNVIDENDVVKIGYSDRNPELYFALNLGFEYSGFGFEALLQGVANQTLYLTTKSVFVPLLNGTNISTYSNGAWTPETAATATLPRLTLVANANNYRQNNLSLFSADYLKLRQIEFFYKIPAHISKIISINKAKIYVRGMNLLSIDNVKVLDPEYTGVDYPTLASYHLGFKFEF